MAGEGSDSDDKIVRRALKHLTKEQRIERRKQQNRDASKKRYHRLKDEKKFKKDKKEKDAVSIIYLKIFLARNKHI